MLRGSQSFICRESRKSAAMIKGSLYICDDCCATSCDAEGIANMAGFFSFANLSRFFFLSQNLQIFGLALRKKAQYVVVAVIKHFIQLPIQKTPISREVFSRFTSILCLENL